MVEMALADRISAPYASPQKLIVRIETGDAPPESVSARALSAALAVAIIGTSLSGAGAPIVALNDVTRMAEPLQVLAVVEMLRTIRRRTALTWDHLASIFGVTRRSLHHWANGQPVSPEHELSVRLLHDKVVALKPQPAYLARAAILQAYGIQPTSAAARASEPILVADQSPVSSRVRVTKSPRTRVR